MTRVADLKVEQLAIILGQTHQVMTSQTLFALGGELLEVHKKALSSMKQQGDGSEACLTLRIQVGKKMSWSEKRWRDRLQALLTLGLRGQLGKWFCVALLFSDTWPGQTKR